MIPGGLESQIKEFHRRLKGTETFWKTVNAEAMPSLKTARWNLFLSRCESGLISRVKRDSARVHADTPASEICRFPVSGFDLRLDGSLAVPGRIPKVLASTVVASESGLEFATSRA